jgi:7,8-dihydropterin-6-yl-methyl-4-(beta-D-ribofuranosyl)aminobenzene 5'-phosphate synthase
MLRAIKLINAAKASLTEAEKDPVRDSTPNTKENKITVDLHPSRPDFRGVTLPTFQLSLEADPTFAEISDAGGKISLNSETHTVLDEFFLISGEIPRVTEYEMGLRRGARFVKEKGMWEKDELIEDERFVVCKLKGMWLVSFPCLTLHLAQRTCSYRY